MPYISADNMSSHEYRPVAKTLAMIEDLDEGFSDILQAGQLVKIVVAP
jgi:hypothetical protein